MPTMSLLTSRHGAVIGGLRMISHTVDTYSYPLAKAMFLMRQPNPVKTNPVLVYTVGKVGTSSVVATLAKSLNSRPVVHVHFLSRDNLRHSELTYRGRARAYQRTSKMRRFLPHHVWLGEQIREAIDSAPPGTVWDVVTLVRDPVARNVSAFFQNLEREHDIWLAEALNARTPGQIADHLVQLFLQDYVDSGHNPVADGDPLTWFSDELESVFNVDVFRTEFPVSRGFDTYTTDNARVLLLRLEDLQSRAEQAFGEFFGVPVQTVVMRNDAADKAYGEVYRRFKARLRLPKSYLSRLYSSQYSRHFYSDSELRSLRARWTGEQQEPADAANPGQGAAVYTGVKQVP